MADSETNGTPPCDSQNVKDALREHLQKWHAFDSQGKLNSTPIDPQPTVPYYTLEEVEALGINILEKE
jgi:hypothetical protein